MQVVLGEDGQRHPPVADAHEAHPRRLAAAQAVGAGGADRHLPLDVAVAPGSRYVNLGEWVNYCSYGVYDGNELALRHFEQ